MPAPPERRCCIHVRRGDQLHHDKGLAWKEQGWTLPLEYYDVAVKRLPRDLFYVVTTDSPVDGFVAHLLVFMDVSVVDLRAMSSPVLRLDFIRADATSMDMFETGSVDSLSSLHAAEHFGLGRYGDTVDPDACFVFMRNLERILGVGGRLWFSVPIGEDRVFFNAHRVFSPMTILEAFDGLSLVSFSAVTRQNSLAEDVRPESYLENGYKVGLFEFTKLAA